MPGNLIGPGGGQVPRDGFGQMGGGPTGATPIDITWMDIDGEHPAIEAIDLERFCNATGLTTSQWKGKVTVVKWPSGAYPGKCTVLMSRKAVEAMNLNGFHTVRIGLKDDVIIFSNLVVSRHPINVTPGVEDDENAVYMVEFSDARWLAMNNYFSTPINKQYNVRAPSSGDIDRYYEDSLIAGAGTWSWGSMMTDIWNTVNVEVLGDSPSLPFIPDGEPDGIKLIGMSAWKAYNMLLDRLGCRFVLYPSGTTAIVRIGATDNNFTAAITDLRDKLVFQDQPYDIVMGKAPSGVYVYFNKYHEHYGSEDTTSTTVGQWSTSAVHYVYVPAPADILQFTYPGTAAFLWDDLDAIIAIDKTIINEAELGNRAQERADDYYRRVVYGGLRTHKVYGGYIDDVRIFPGSQVSAISWYDVGNGPRTEIINTASMMMVSANNEWAEVSEDENFSRPDLARKTYPNYPLVLQMIEIQDPVPGGDGSYDARVVRFNPEDQTWIPGEKCWLFDANS